MSLEALLLKVEWSELSGTTDCYGQCACCPVCLGHKHDGHSDQCDLKVLIDSCTKGN